MNNPKQIHISEFVYDLPESLIARHPLAQRDACRLLVADGKGKVEDRIFSELPQLLPADTLLVCNNPRVVNARLFFRKPSGAAIEIFCLEPERPADYDRNFAATEGVSWKCLVGNSKRWKEGKLERVLDIDGRKVTLTAERHDKSADGTWTVDLGWDDATVPFSTVIEAAGGIPSPH